MIPFLEEFKLIFKSLLRHNVEFLLVGGYAVNYHGYNRSTGDMDIWLKPDNANKANFLAMLKNENFNKNSLKIIENLNFEDANCFHIGKPPKRIDFLTKISGVEFAEAWKERVFLKFEDFNVPVLQLNHLIISKIATGRLQDKADIEFLQKIVRLKKRR